MYLGVNLEFLGCSISQVRGVCHLLVPYARLTVPRRGAQTVHAEQVRLPRECHTRFRSLTQ